MSVVCISRSVYFSVAVSHQSKWSNLYRQVGLYPSAQVSVNSPEIREWCDFGGLHWAAVASFHVAVNTGQAEDPENILPLHAHGVLTRHTMYRPHVTTSCHTLMLLSFCAS